MNIMKLMKIKRKEADEEKYEKLDVSGKQINWWWLLCCCVEEEEKKILKSLMKI